MNGNLDDVKELLKMFRLERIVYVVICIAAFIALLISAGIILINGGDKNYGAVIGIFGASGGIGYATTRLLKMWSDALEFLNKVREDEQSEKK